MNPQPVADLVCFHLESFKPKALGAVGTYILHKARIKQ
ncbi:hypothetical protein FOTG_17618 [Fusarium oxysporum f. sp. vasinfectum 25433]|uniref:Uncharacterized protein n=1 Tax=Fusarium oxysporum f. sp. vasinfectum 25433 TaxID=1089449 RepID=X0LZS7_FUSOX|nr:hypothetical protein FOTG_18038 [Fusarium oxysporum f. sp. vasinfectum 25433]EXM13940.1 hypothetical protein FOTG_17618 [Fusarium oxysporum f. sp. vasinfectum 25433]